MKGGGAKKKKNGKNPKKDVQFYKVSHKAECSGGLGEHVVGTAKGSTDAYGKTVADDQSRMPPLVAKKGVGEVVSSDQLGNQGGKRNRGVS